MKSRPKTWDCQSCGLCCRVGYAVPLTPGERKKFAANPALAILVNPECGCCMKNVRDGWWCAALRGGRGRYRCAIYGKRPAVCRRFEPGEDRCLQLRRSHRK